MTDETKPKKKLTAVHISALHDPNAVTVWSREEDHLDSASVAEGNVLVLFDEDRDAIAIINPMAWGTVVSEYEVAE